MCGVCGGLRKVLQLDFFPMTSELSSLEVVSKVYRRVYVCIDTLLTHGV